MAWKNIKQRSFADDHLVNHSAIEELDDVHDLINWERIENLLSDIHTKVQGEKSLATVNDVQGTPSPKLVWLR